MPQRPSAISLMLCDQVVFEQGTQKPYLLGVFNGVAADRFPTAPQRFDVFAALTDGLGAVTLKLSVLHLETDQQIYVYRMKVRFPDPLRVVHMRVRVRRLVSAASGNYLFALAADDQEIAASRVRVYQEGEGP